MQASKKWAEEEIIFMEQHSFSSTLHNLSLLPEIKTGIMLQAIMQIKEKLEHTLTVVDVRKLLHEKYETLALEQKS